MAPPARPRGRNTPATTARTGYRGSSRAPAPAPRPRPNPTVDAGAQARGAGMNAWYQAGNPGDRSMPASPGSEPMPDADPLADLFMGTPPINPGGSPRGNSRGNSRGGGGSAAAEKAALRKAYSDALAAIGTEYDSYGEELKGLYDPAQIKGKYMDAGNALGRAHGGGRLRVNKIYNDQMGRNDRARTAVAGAFSGGQAALGGLQQQFQANNAATNGGLNASLGAFGAGELADQNGGRLNELFGAGQIFNQNQATTMDAAQADRGAIYGAAAQDVLGGMSADNDAIFRRLVQSRLAEEAEMRRTGAAARHQNSTNRLGATTDIRLKLAELGIV